MSKVKAILAAVVFLAAWNEHASAQTTPGATPARTQAAPVPGSVADLDERRDVLDGLIRELEANRKVLFTGSGEVMVIDVDRLHRLARWMVTSGKLSAPDAAIWTNEQLTASNRGIGALKEELATIHRMRDNARDRDQIGGGRVTPVPTGAPAATAPPPGSADWPDPMDWRKVRGTVSGTYLVTCRSADGRALPEVRGEFTLALFGNGSVTATYENSGSRYPTQGTIEGENEGKHGVARGSGKGLLATYTWSARLRRGGATGNTLTMDSTTAELRLTPDDAGYTCDPGFFFPY